MSLKKITLRSLLFILISVVSTTTRAQLVVTPAATPLQLANNLVGVGVTVLNPTLNCGAGADVGTNAEGIFVATGTTLGIDSGLVLTCGSATALSTSYYPSMAGPSTSLGTPGDAQLTTLSGNTTHDACILEFDFVSTGDTVKFDYVFGSYEYDNYSCSSFNDVFGFFISGPGIVGAPNIALIPGTTIPVAVNSTTDPVAMGAFSTASCTAMGTGSPFSMYFVNNSLATSFINLPGFTVPFTAFHQVIPCDTYHLKLAIADASDGILDSDVFLKAGSLQSNAISIEPITLLTIGTDTGVVVRGCLPAIIKFQLSQPSDTDFTIHYIIGGTAVEGTDYAPIPDSAIVLGSTTSSASGDTVSFLLDPYLSATPTGPKTVTIDVLSPFSCAAATIISSATITILDSLPVFILNPDDTICSSQFIQMDLATVMGDSLMTFYWTPTTGVSDPNIKEPIIYPPVGTTTYTVHAYYAGVPCDTSTDQFTITATPSPLTVDAGPDFSVCANQIVNLGATITPTLGSTVFGWTADPTLSSTTVLNPVALPWVTTTYYLSVTDYAGCTYFDSATVHITGVAPSVVASASRDTVCPGGSVDLSALIGGLQPCGLALSACTGGIPSDEYVGTGVLATTSPTPYAMTDNTEGDHLQILYSRQDLLNSGVRPGFINSLAFNVSGKLSLTTDTFRNYSIRMACTNTPSLKDSNFVSYPGMVTVLPPTNVGTINGWNTYNFPVPYYWDGSSNLVMEICWEHTYGFFGTDRFDEVYATGTSYNSVLWYGSHLYTGVPGSACSADNGTFNVASNLRPNTRFNVCTPDALYTYNWTPAGNLSSSTSPAPTASNINNSTTYTVTVSSSTNPACNNTDAVTVGVDNSNAIDALPHSPYVLCQPGYGNLDAIATGNPPISNLSCGTAGTVTCTTPDVTTVGQTGGPSASGSPFAGNYNSAKTQFIIDRRDMLNSNMPSGTLQKVSFYVGNVSSIYPYDTFSLSIGCTPETSYANPNGFIGGLTQVYTSNSQALVPNSWNTFTFTTPYNWDTNMNIAMQICYSEVPFTAAGPDEVWTTGTPGYNTIQSYQFTNGICNTPSGATYVAYAQRPTVQFTYCSAPPAPFEYTWYPGNNLSDSSIKNPVVYVAGPTTYYVSTTGRNGCVVTDSVHIFIPTHDYGITPVDTNICPGDRVLYNITGSNIASYTWYENGFTTPATNLSCSNCGNPVATPTQDVTYNVIINDVVNCPDTVSAHIHVYPPPPVDILNNDTTIKYGTSFMLLVNGARDYSWSPVGSLSDPRMPNPIASPVEPTDYIVIGLDEHGCKASDHIHVDIDYRDSLMVPSAFTPNGDGRNDVFRVVGITFHKLMEFRVFNRWGQEIYSTIDPKAGWDGNWKGVLQDMGVYNYIIRVAFPDGTMETYKGDVTLIR